MSEISVVVVGSTSVNSVVGNGDTVNVNVGNQTVGGGNGAAATIEAGTVTTIDATQTATVTNVGTAYAAKFNFSLPRGSTGAAGPANSLSIGTVSTGTTAAVSISGTSPSQTLSFVLQPGPTGPANSLSIGSVSTGTTAAVSITGTAPSQSLSFVLPQGPTGPANSLSIGSVSTGATAAVSISGSAPSQQLSFVLQPGPTGPANSLSIGSVSTGATAAVSISGSAPSQQLSFVLQPGPTGPANSLSIGSVTTGTTAAVSISGSAPSQSLSFVLPVGPKGDTGAQGPSGPSGSVNLADETPQPLGTASAGTALTAARADHVHAVGSVQYSSLSGIPLSFTPSAHSHAVSDVTGLQAVLDSKQAAGNYAPLVNNLVPSANLPSFVDDVVDVGGTLPASGDVGKIYVVSTGANTNKIYRWSGSAFIEISPSPGSTDSVAEGSTNLYHTTVRAAAAAPVQSVAGRTGTVTLTAADVGAAATSHTHALADLTQSSATTGQVATWNGTAWAPATPSVGGGGSFSGTVDGGDYVGTIVGGGGGGTPVTDPLFSSVRLLINADLATYGYDSSSNNWSVSSVGNAIATTTNPKFGAKSLAFDGNGDYMKVVTGSSTFAFGTGDFTAEAWIFFPNLPTQSNQYFSLFDTRSDSENGYAVFVNQTGQLAATWGNTSNGASLFGSTLNTATWHHVALVRSAGTMRLYANGFCVANGSTNVGVNMTHNQVWVSRSFTESTYLETNGLMGYWNGNIDDIRLTAAARYTGTSSTSTNFTVPAAAFPTS